MYGKFRPSQESVTGFQPNYFLKLPKSFKLTFKQKCTNMPVTYGYNVIS